MVTRVIRLDPKYSISKAAYAYDIIACDSTPIHISKLIANVKTGVDNNLIQYLSTVSDNTERLTSLVPVCSTPRSVEIHPTRRCNQSCLYCANTSTNSVSELHFSKWLEVINELVMLHATQLTISGGEPLLYPGILDILSLLQKSPIAVSILTNGLLIPSLLENFDFVPSIKFSISLDSTCCSTHDFYRGKDTCSKAKKAIAFLSDRGARFAISMTVSSLNIDDIGYVYDFAQNNNAEGLRLGLIENMGSAKYAEICPSSLGYQDLSYQVRKVIQELDKDFIIFAEDELSKEPNVDDLIFCSAGTSRLVIAPDGSVFPCVLCFSDENFLVGNVLNETINDMWMGNKWGLTRTGIEMSRLEVCLRCSSVTTCAIKNCRLGAVLNGNLYGVPASCKVSP